MDWEVKKVPLFARDDKMEIPLGSSYAVVRSDRWGQSDCPALGIVGEAYTPLQNKDAFAFFDPIVGENKAIYHTAGVLGDGERVWILAKLPSDIIVKKEDITHKYLLLSNSHDGKSSVQVKFTPIRVVCQNTLTMALSQGRTIRVTHTKDMPERLQRAREMLGIIERRYEAIGSTFKRMCEVQVDRGRLSQYLHKFSPIRRTKTTRRAGNGGYQNRLLAEYFFDEGKGNRQPGVHGTLWAAYNGVIELVDHRETKQADDPPS
jgi:phage/plasmid-like protein (TIGR03299 family)